MRRLGLLLALAGCKPTEVGLARRLEAANHCQVPSDCVDLGSFCPFGCNQVVHVDEAPALRQALTKFLEDGRDTCPLDCEPVAAIRCDAFRCVPVYGQ